jgi:hypothetical protein
VITLAIVAIKDVELPPPMQRAMACQAEAMSACAPVALQP